VLAPSPHADAVSLCVASGLQVALLFHSHSLHRELQESERGPGTYREKRAEHRARLGVLFRAKLALSKGREGTSPEGREVFTCFSPEITERAFEITENSQQPGEQGTESRRCDGFPVGVGDCLWAGIGRTCVVRARA
jgi:hypothetical protein